MSITYKDAGVDVESGYKAVNLMKDHVQKTFNANVLSGLGSFGAYYALDNIKMNQPVLVAGTDGVGTKLKIAFMLDKHDTIGQDCVAMCVNDIACQGAKPLFFMDYIATGKVYPEKISEIVKGISDGCLDAECALIGGETAEMPGFYHEDEYDLAGFSVGIVDKEKIINGKEIKAGDILIGLESSGIHSNGYSLVRKLLFTGDTSLKEYSSELGCAIGEELLKPTRIYVRTLNNLMNKYSIKGIAHITGGGFIENIPRMLPEGLQAKVKIGSWPIKPIFHILQKAGDIPENSIYNTFNMGIGMVLAVQPMIADQIVDECKTTHQNAYVIGEVISGEAGVQLCR